MGVSLAIHHYPFKLAHDSLWPPYKMEAFCLRHHPFTTSHFLERSMTYPARLQKTYWLPFVRTNITLWRGLVGGMTRHRGVLAQWHLDIAVSRAELACLGRRREVAVLRRVDHPAPLGVELRPGSGQRLLALPLAG